jgi:catechol 2,3-dioxygenase
MSKYHGAGIRHVAQVGLAVADLKRSEAFYRDTLGFTVVSSGPGSAVVSADGSSILLTLTELPGARPRGRTAGLYHVAFLLPSRADLGAFLRRAIATQLPIRGAADHRVSEAIYLEDPDGNGLEFYADTDDADWRDGSGALDMGTEAFDYEGVYYAAEGSLAHMPEETRIGHLHLAVRDLAASFRFYRDIVGFAVSSDDYPSAYFFASSGYHHHLAINNWERATSKREDRAGIRTVVLSLPDCESAEEILRHAKEEGVLDGDELVDPDGTRLLLTVA